MNDIINNMHYKSNRFSFSLYKQKGFTLLELIIVIIIIGVLATLGFTQYTNLIENMRGAEAKVNIGVIRKLAEAYYLANGNVSSLTNADLNIGSSSGQIPSSCTSTNYFRYSFWINSGVEVGIGANRCTSGGKSPQYGGVAYVWTMHDRPDTVGFEDWGCQQPDGTYKWISATPGSCP